MTNFRVMPHAEIDLIEHFAYIARDKLLPADRFLKVAEQSFRRVAEMPGMGRVWETANPQLDGIRVYAMPAPYRSYLIFYRTAHDGFVEILAILHGARDIGMALDQIVRPP